MGLTVRKKDGTSDRGMAGALLSSGSFGASGAGAQAFWWTGWGAQGWGKSTKSSPDAGRGEPAGFALSFPGQAEVLDDGSGQAQLGVGGDDERGPAVGLLGGTHRGCGPAEGVLDEPEGVFDVEPA